MTPDSEALIRTDHRASSWPSSTPSVFWQIHRSTVVNVNAHRCRPSHAATATLELRLKHRKRDAAGELDLRASLQADVSLQGAPALITATAGVLRWRGRWAWRALGGWRLARHAASSGSSSPARTSRALDAETALPVQVIRREEIERSGAADGRGTDAAASAPTSAAANEAIGRRRRRHPGLLAAPRCAASARGRRWCCSTGAALANYAFSGERRDRRRSERHPAAAIDRVEILQGRRLGDLRQRRASPASSTSSCAKDFRGVEVDGGVQLM